MDRCKLVKDRNKILNILNRKSHLEEPEIDCRVLVEWILKKSAGRASTGQIYQRIETSGVLRTR